MPRNRAEAIAAAQDVSDLVSAAGPSLKPVGTPVGPDGLQLWAVKRRDGRTTTTVRDRNGRTVASLIIYIPPYHCVKCLKDKEGNEIFCWSFVCEPRDTGRVPTGRGGPVIR